MFPKIVIHSGRVKRFTRWSRKPKTQGSNPIETTSCESAKCVKNHSDKYHSQFKPLNFLVVNNDSMSVKQNKVKKLNIKDIGYL